MPQRLVLLLACCAAATTPCLEGCSSSPEDCKFCDFGLWATGPEIVAKYASIAAIETAAPCGDAQDPCGVAFDTPAWVGPGDPVSPPLVDAGWATDLCARRYACREPPPPLALDGAASSAVTCGRAWLNLRMVNHCLATVISSTGERQSFEVTKTTGECRSFRCRRGPGECYSLEQCAFELSPSSITVYFATSTSYDAGATDAASSGD